jgi:hypothetical protein
MSKSNYDIVDIATLGIGDIIQFHYSQDRIRNYEHMFPILAGEIVAIYNSGLDRCVVWKGTISTTFYSSWSVGHLDVWSRDPKNYITTDNREYSNEYKQHAWIPPGTLVKVIRSALLFLNQKCIGCNLPAPHVKPNVGDAFVCRSCQFIESI